MISKAVEFTKGWIDKSVGKLKRMAGLKEQLVITPKIERAIINKPRTLLTALCAKHEVDRTQIEDRITTLRRFMAASSDLARQLEDALQHTFVPGVDPRVALVGIPSQVWEALDLGNPNMFMAGEAHPKQPNKGSKAQRQQSQQARKHKTRGHPLSGFRSRRITVVNPNGQYSKRNSTSSSCVCSVWVLVALTSLSVALQEHQAGKEIGAVREAASSVLSSPENDRR